MVAVEHDHIFLAEALLAFYVERVLRTVHLDGDDESQFFYLFVAELTQVTHIVGILHSVEVECEPHIGSAASSAQRADESEFSVKGLAIGHVFFNI